MTQYVGAIDQGTTGTRFMVFDHAGQVVANAYEKHEQIYPNPGWVEHDPLEIWENTKQVVLDGLEDAGLEASQLEALGITNQRETTIVWDRETGRPVHNALVWQDRRTTDRVEEIQALRRRPSGSSTTQSRSRCPPRAVVTSESAPATASSSWAPSTRGSSTTSRATTSRT
jgi:glycerol kinase